MKLTRQEIDTALAQLSTGRHPIEAFKILAHIREQEKEISDLKHDVERYIEIAHQELADR